jgi:hypothetical protein
MSTSARRLHHTYAQYLALEEPCGVPSLREVLFVSHRAPQLTLHRRGDAGWAVTTAEGGAVLELSSLSARIAVDELYRDGLEDAGP